MHWHNVTSIALEELQPQVSADRHQVVPDRPPPGGIRSERRLCEEVHLNLAYRWFCRLGLDGAVPDHSTFSKSRHGRFRESDLLRRLFETVLQRCIDEGLVGGEGFAVDASLIQADASDRSV